jgi:signal transduction histidine kinase
MPTYGDFSLFWVGSFYSGYLAVAAFYGIIKYGLFDIKLVFTEFITVIIWVFLFIKILLDKNTVDRIIDSVLLLLILVSGYLFIKAVKKEIVLREKDDELVTDVTILNQQLEKTNLQLKELDLKKSEFMSLATHQLRAPLTAMKGYSSMILDGTFGKISNPEIEDAINKISRSTTDLTMIVEDYLNISRIEQGSMRYNFTTSNVSDLLKDVVENVKNTADRLGLIMNLNYDTNTKYNVNVDEGKIKQVFLNIIDNAIKYTPVGEVNIFINKTLNNKVLVKIEDTGVGIKPEVLPNLFNKFVRAPDASKVNILGTGLGLYVAGQILKAHNGRAWGESKGKGEGSKFYVELPGV